MPKAIAVHQEPELAQQTADGFREAMRRLAASVMLITSRDDDGTPHGMAASSVISVSMDPPSLLIAVNKTAGLHPVLVRARRFCVNLLSDQQADLLTPFSTSALREERFRSEGWQDAWDSKEGRLPWLPQAPASVECDVEVVTEYGTHSLFIGRVTRVHCLTPSSTDHAATKPLVWLAGQRASLYLKSCTR